MTNLCIAATCAKVALDKIVCDAIATSALDYYAQVVELLRSTVGIDINTFFQLVAFLAVLCWVQKWFVEIIALVCRLPKVIKNIFCGKFNLCLLECDGEESEKSEKSEKSHHSKKSESTESDDY